MKKKKPTKPKARLSKEGMRALQRHGGAHTPKKGRGSYNRQSEKRKV